MDAQESRDAYEIFLERHRAGSMVVTSARGPRVARHLRRSHPRPERHRPLHQQRLRPRHRGRVLPRPTQAQPEGRPGLPQGHRHPRMTRAAREKRPDGGCQDMGRPPTRALRGASALPHEARPAHSPTRDLHPPSLGRTTIPPARLAGPATTLTPSREGPDPGVPWF
jgi:hypothetical protein